MTYEEKIEEIIGKIGGSFIAPIATVSKEGKASVRMISFIRIEREFYFQTDMTMGKATDIANNPSVAVCVNEMQIKGTCYEMGTVSDNQVFENEYRNAFPSAYKKYSHLSNERVYRVQPSAIICWSYIDDKPCYEIIDIENERYELKPY